HWNPVDIESQIAGFKQTSSSILQSLMVDGATTGPLLPLLSRLTTPTLLLRADPKIATLLEDKDWEKAQRMLSNSGTALQIKGSAYNIHRSRLDLFLRVVEYFTCTLDDEYR